MDQTAIERAAIAQALYKAIAPFVKTGNPDNLRGRMDSEFRKVHDETGAMRFDVSVAGEKVGTYTFSTRSVGETNLLEWDDDLEVLEWMSENGYAFIDRDAVQEHFEETGETPPGARITHYPAEERVVPQFRVEVEKVKEALGASLPGAVDRLLEAADGR